MHSFVTAHISFLISSSVIDPKSRMIFLARTYRFINLRSWERMVAHLAGHWIGNLSQYQCCRRHYRLYLMNFASSTCIDGPDMSKVGVRFGNQQEFLWNWRGRHGISNQLAIRKESKRDALRCERGRGMSKKLVPGRITLCRINQSGLVMRPFFFWR